MQEQTHTHRHSFSKLSINLNLQIVAFFNDSPWSAVEKYNQKIILIKGSPVACMHTLSLLNKHFQHDNRDTLHETGSRMHKHVS